jgi:glycosyltransferase involved in cell wall biosynthesis
VRILNVVHQSVPTWIGGVEIYTQALAKALIGRGHKVEIFVREDGNGGMRSEEFDGVRVHRFWAPGRSEAQRWLATFGEAAAEAAFAHVLDQCRPDLVHFQHLLGLPAALFEAVMRRRLPAIVTLHDYWFICANTKLLTNYNERLCGGPRAWVNCGMCGLARMGAPWAAPLVGPALAPVFALRDFRLRRILLQADALIAPTEFVRNMYLQHGAPPDRVVVIEYGIEPPPIQPTPLPRDGPLRVAYLGGVARLKGVHVLVEAFNAMPPDAQLRIAGDLTRQPAYVRDLQSMVRHSGVRFLGQQGRAGSWALLDWADVVAVPSIWYEVSPLVTHEAFAMRRPVVASNIGSLAGRVRDEVDGLLAPPGDGWAWGEILGHLARHRRRLLKLQSAIRPPKTAAQHADELESLYEHHIRKQAQS